MIPETYNRYALPKIPFWIFILIAALYCSAARVDIMDIDAAQYAEMSREMLDSHNCLQLFDHGRDYLDKPPFLFWVSSLSMRVFGANNFGYRFPSILFALLALYATYRLARLLYDEATGRAAALVLGVCQGLFLMTNDVRTDTILMGWVITAIWCIKECELKRRWYFVLGGCLAIACGLMTKGPIALFVPVFAMGSDWVLKRKWKQLFSPWHLFDVVLIGVLLIPMSIGLYQQFDLHPEKLIDGRHGTSGLRFFYWSQSFGRITGESDWDNGADISFLLVNMLWAFLPWIFLFLAALFVNVKKLIRQRFKLTEQQEWISTGGFLLSYLALGLSHYQLPHYIFVAFPLAAIMVAALFRDFWVAGKYPKLMRVFNTVQAVITGLLFVGVLLILTIVFPAGWLGIALWLAAVSVWFYFTFRSRLPGKMLIAGAATMLLINVFLTHYFYYTLLHYQAGSQVGRYVRKEGIGKRFESWEIEDPLTSLDFYAQQQLWRISGSDSVSIPNKQFLLTTDKGLTRLQALGKSYSIIRQAPFFKVSELTPDFLNHKTRHKATKQYYLLQLQ